MPQANNNLGIIYPFMTNNAIKKVIVKKVHDT